MSLGESRSPSPRRVAAGKRNQLLSRGLSDRGRERLRESALRSQPWQHATGPRSDPGKARVAANGKLRKKGQLSVRDLRAQLRDARSSIKTVRRLLSELESLQLGTEPSDEQNCDRGQCHT